MPPGLSIAPAYSENALASTIVMIRRMIQGEIPVLAAYIRHEPPVSLRARTAQLIGNDLEGHTPAAEDIAQRFHMSARTLRRLLRAEGCNYRDILTEVQREVSFRYLCDRAVSIGEISYRMGFSDPNAFHRAFKRWTGRPPGEFRAGARLGRSEGSG